MSGYGISPLTEGAQGAGTTSSTPSPTDLLIATAQLHSGGKLGAQPSPMKPHKGSRRLKVIK